MSKWPDRRVSRPRDQPTRYFAEGHSSLVSSEVGRFARKDENERSRARRGTNEAGSSFTMRMPREVGPNAASRLEKGTVPVDGESDTAAMRSVDF